jgi:hypothetical protein
MRPVPTIILISALTACEPFGPGAGDTDTIDDLGEGHLTIEVTSIVFDDLSVLHDPTAETSIIVRNSGLGELKVAGMDRVIGSDVAFSTDAPALMIIPAGETEEVVVSFHPQTSGLFEGLLFPNAQVSIDLSGIGTAPIAKLNPTEPAFSDLAVGCDETLMISLANQGDEPLVIGDVYVEGSASFSVTDVTQDSLEPDETTDLYVRYAPIDGGINAATLLVQTNDPLTPTSTATLIAVGYKGGLVEQSEVYDSDSETDDNGWAIWELIETPVVTTIEVTSNGRAIYDWTYDNTENSVSVDTAATTITMGDDILFTYLSEVSCE